MLDHSYTTVGGHLSSTGISVIATEGESFRGVKVAGFRGADELTSAGVHAVTINCGDAITSSGTVTRDGVGGFIVLGSHTYAEEGAFPVTVQISDLDATSSTASGSATVADVALATSGLHVRQHNDSVNGVAANFSDADPVRVIGDYSAVVTWSDGASSPGTIAASGAGFTMSGSHHYTRDKEKAIIRVSITDAGGSTAAAPTIATEFKE
jgi:hypothetical protein